MKPIKHGHHKVLEALRKAGPQGMTVAELVAHFGVTPRQIRKLIARLVERSMIESMPCPRSSVGRPRNIWYARGHR